MKGTIVEAEQRYAIEELVYRSCLALDAGDYKTFLSLCTPDFRYTLSLQHTKKDLIRLTSPDPNEE